ncbi:uncharacterized protein PAC_01829 [Phialocephala subalpina]|uniref:Uncharacterized protein n=1 Tax=Phialocephala subalpina TaxID=576137 RepID=A0A1L7WGQ9_9HELO|nr:uncharacterized protein PAC_01829 [Phialocephala subalpina]
MPVFGQGRDRLYALLSSKYMIIPWRELQDALPQFVKNIKGQEGAKSIQDAVNAIKSQTSKHTDEGMTNKIDGQPSRKNTSTSFDTWHQCNSEHVLYGVGARAGLEYEDAGARAKSSKMVKEIKKAIEKVDLDGEEYDSEADIALEPEGEVSSEELLPAHGSGDDEEMAGAESANGDAGEAAGRRLDREEQLGNETEGEGGEAMDINEAFDDIMEDEMCQCSRIFICDLCKGQLE